MNQATTARKLVAQRKPRPVIDITQLIADAQRAYDALVARRAAEELKKARRIHR